MRAVRVGGPPVEPGIELVDLVEGDAGERRRHAEVHLAVEVDLPEVHPVGDRREDDTVAIRFRDDRGDREQAGHVGPGLPRQPQRPDVRRLPPRAVAGRRAHDVALAPVVGGRREQPVAVEVLRELGEIVEGGAGRGHDVTAGVVPPALLQPVEPSGRGNELPQPGRFHRGVGEGLERALDDRQQRELQRHSALLDLAHDIGQVEPGPVRRAPEVVLVLRVPADLALDARVRAIRQRQPVTDARPRIGDDGCRTFAGRRLR